MLILSSLLCPATPQTAPKPSTAGDQSEEKTFASIESLVGSKSYEKAESLLQSAISQGTPPARAYFRMGKIFLDYDDWQRAADYLEKSLQVQQDNDQAHLLIGLTYRELKQPERAEKEFIRAVELNPHSDVNAYFAGRQLIVDEKYEAALAYLYRAVELNPADAAALRALGMAQARLGSYGLAESYYRKAVEAAGATPDAAAAYTDLAYLLLLGHDPAKAEEALRCAQRAAKLNPSSPDAHYLAGKALFKLGRVPQAVPELREAEKLRPDDSKPHFLLAQAYDRLGEKQKADAERQALARAKTRAPTAGVAGGNALPPDPQ